MQNLRSWMFVPGHQQRMVDKALGLELDAAIFDLEDGVPSDKKNVARERVAKALSHSSKGPLRFVRTHPVGSARIDVDLDAVVQQGLDGLVLPKVDRAEDLLLVDNKLEIRESSIGFERGRVQLVALIESARGLIQAPAIAASCSRLVGLMFGAEDFALDLGVFTTGEGNPGDWIFARSSLVVAAASERLQVIDRAYLNIWNPEGMLEDSRFARELGFTGKSVIHPNQIETIHRVFTPNAVEVEQAKRIVDAFEEAEIAGLGAVTVEGQMVDLPIVERARRILKLMDL